MEEGGFDKHLLMKQFVNYKNRNTIIGSIKVVIHRIKETFLQLDIDDSEIYAFIDILDRIPMLEFRSGTALFLAWLAGGVPRLESRGNEILIRWAKATVKPRQLILGNIIEENKWPPKVDPISPVVFLRYCRFVTSLGLDRSL